jgi:hypothetical protein
LGGLWASYWHISYMGSGAIYLDWWLDLLSVLAWSQEDILFSEERMFPSYFHCPMVSHRVLGELECRYH